MCVGVYQASHRMCQEIAASKALMGNGLGMWMNRQLAAAWNKWKELVSAPDMLWLPMPLGS